MKTSIHILGKNKFIGHGSLYGEIAKSGEFTETLMSAF